MAARSRVDGMTCGALFAGRDNADGLRAKEETRRNSCYNFFERGWTV